MIFDAYKVAVELSIVDKVGPFLTVFSRQLAGAGQNVTALEKRLSSLGKIAAAGGILAGAGIGALAMAEKFGQAAAQYETYWSRMRQMGLGDAQIADARKWVVSNDIIGTSIRDRTRLFVEAQGAFRESGMSGAAALDAAKTMTPVLANYVTARTMLGKETSEQDEMNLNKIVEQLGGLNNTGRAKEIADAVFKAAQSSGGMVDARQLRLFRTYGMTATASMSDRAIFGGLEPIIGELGGSTAGTGLQTAYNRLNGIMSLAPHLLVQEATRLGIWDKSKVELTRGGAARFPHGDPLDPRLRDLMAHDLPAFATELLKRYKTAGISDPNEIARENAILFNTTGSRFYNLLMKQLPVVEKSLASYDQARGIGQTVDDNKNSPQMQMLQLHKSLDDLGLEIGQSVLPVLTPLVKEFAAFFRTIDRRPDLIRALTVGFIGLSAAMTFGGTLMLLRAGFGGLGVAFTVLRATIPALVAGLGGVSVAGTLAGALGGLAAIPIMPIVAGLAALAAVIWGISKIPSPKKPDEGALIPGGKGSRYALPAGTVPPAFPGTMDVPGRLIVGGHGSRMDGVTVPLASYSNEGRGSQYRDAYAPPPAVAPPPANTGIRPSVTVHTAVDLPRYAFTLPPKADAASSGDSRGSALSANDFRPPAKSASGANGDGAAHVSKEFIASLADMLAAKLSGAKVVMDGTTVGNLILDHMSREASRPSTGTSSFDTHLGPLRPDYGF